VSHGGAVTLIQRFGSAANLKDEHQRWSDAAREIGLLPE
jgi:hypothetical protein